MWLSDISQDWVEPTGGGSLRLVPFPHEVGIPLSQRKFVEEGGILLILQEGEEGATSQGSQETVKRLLSSFLDLSPEDLALKRNPWGKPFLETTKSGSDQGLLKFNLSHSGGLSIYGFSLNRNLGVDVEEITPRSVPDRLVKRFFSTQEQEFFFSQDEEEWNNLFHRLWTRKEAVVKALGRGLGLGLGTFSVVPLEESRVQVKHRETGAIHNLVLHSLDLPPGYQGAVAWEL